jgi:solute:Na+ symporter, SSS family
LSDDLPDHSYYLRYSHDRAQHLRRALFKKFQRLLCGRARVGRRVNCHNIGLGYRVGLQAWWWVCAAGIGSLLLAFTIAPKIWRVARNNNLYTVGDYLEFRYDKRVRALASVLLWMGSLVIFAGQLIGGAALLNVVAGINKITGYIVAAAVVTFYFSIGGLHTAVRVNVLQLAVKLVGFLLAVFYLIGQSASLQHSAQNTFAFTSASITTPLFYLATFTPAFIVSPGILQKVFAARDEQAVRRGVSINAVGLLLFAIVPAVLGIAAKARFPALGNSELALPMLLTNVLPFWLGALLLAAIFAAELSAADAVLFMLTTSLSKDLYKAYINPNAADGRLLQVARGTSVICGCLGILLAIGLETVYAALVIFYTLLTAALLVPIIAGLYIRRLTARTMLTSMMASVATTFIVDLISKDQGYTGIPPVIFGIIMGGVIIISSKGTSQK